MLLRDWVTARKAIPCKKHLDEYPEPSEGIFQDSDCCTGSSPNRASGMTSSTTADLLENQPTSRVTGAGPRATIQPTSTPPSADTTSAPSTPPHPSVSYAARAPDVEKCISAR
jgi:hypothetical protein